MVKKKDYIIVKQNVYNQSKESFISGIFEKVQTLYFLNIYKQKPRSNKKKYIYIYINEQNLQSCCIYLYIINPDTDK